MKKLRVLVLVHEDLVAPSDSKGVPPEQLERCKTEYDVVHALEELGHEVQQLGMRDELKTVREVETSLLEVDPATSESLKDREHGNDFIGDYVDL